MDVELSMSTVDGEERVFVLGGPTAVIGRDSRCDVRIALPAVAARHCEIRLDGTVVRLRDLGSATGTWHNDRSVDEAELAPGDRLRVGSVEFTVRMTRAAPEVEVLPDPTRPTPLPGIAAPPAGPHSAG